MNSFLSQASEYLLSHLKKPETHQKVLKLAHQASEQISEESKTIESLASKITSYPIKIISTFIFSPFLMIRVLLQTKSKIKKIIAITGLIFAIIFTYISSTWIGTLSFMWFIKNTVGWFTAFGFLFGTYFSILLTIIINTAVFNFVCFFFLKMNNEEVINHLKETSS